MHVHIRDTLSNSNKGSAAGAYGLTMLSDVKVCMNYECV